MPVPDTTNFSLQNVVDVIPDSQTSLQGCFDDSIDALFDPAYKGSKNSLYNFRNYGSGGVVWFNPDGGGNGDVYDLDSNWNTVRDSADGNGVDTTGSFSVWVDYTGGSYYIYRGFMRFDLRAIYSEATCVDAGLGIDITTTYGDESEVVGLVGTQGDTLTTADFDAFGATFDVYVMNNWVDTPESPFDDFDVALLSNDADQKQRIADAFGGYLYIAFVNTFYDQLDDAPSDKNGIEIYRSGGADNQPGLRIEFST